MTEGDYIGSINVDDLEEAEFRYIPQPSRSLLHGSGGNGASLEWREAVLREAARKLGEVEAEMAAEYVRCLSLGDNSYVAQKKADLMYAIPVHNARAEYEIALSGLNRRD